MPNIIKLSLLLLAGTLFSAAHAQVSTDLLPVPQPDLSVCVDTEPVGDGFGWNGTCTCTLNEPFELSVVNNLRQDTVAIVGSNSPSACIGSDSIFLYSIVNDEWSVTNELTPSARSEGDGFPYNFEIADNAIVASSHGFDRDADGEIDSGYLAVFASEDGFNWNESQILFPDIQGQIVDYAFDGQILVYDRSVLSSDFVNQTHFVHVLEKDSSNNWVETAVFEPDSSNSFLNINRLFVADNSIGILSIPAGVGGFELEIYEKEQEEWVLSYHTDFELNIFSNTQHFNGDIFYIGNLSIEKLDDGTWFRHDTPQFLVSSIGALNYPRVELADSGKRLVTLSSTEEDDISLNCFTESGCINPVSVLTTHKFEDGEWNIIDRITVDGVPDPAVAGIRFEEDQVLLRNNNDYSVYYLDENNFFTNTPLIANTITTEETGESNTQGNTQGNIDAADEGNENTADEESSAQNQVTDTSSVAGDTATSTGGGAIGWPLLVFLMFRRLCGALAASAPRI